MSNKSEWESELPNNQVLIIIYSLLSLFAYCSFALDFTALIQGFFNLIKPFWLMDHSEVPRNVLKEMIAFKLITTISLD